MPIHDFKCEKCNEIKELMVKNSEEQPTCDTCNTCMTKLVSTNISICQTGYSYNTAERTEKKGMS